MRFLSSDGRKLKSALQRLDRYEPLAVFGAASMRLPRGVLLAEQYIQRFNTGERLPCSS